MYSLDRPAIERNFKKRIFFIIGEIFDYSKLPTVHCKHLPMLSALVDTPKKFSLDSTAPVFRSKTHVK